MSLRKASLAIACLFACSAPAQPARGPADPQTAKQKQLDEARANGEVDPQSAKGAAWRYKGTRDNCFFVLGGRCFKTEKDACAAASCQAPSRCTSLGGGPATISCSQR